jgi:hypothetical protein
MAESYTIVNGLPVDIDVLDVVVAADPPTVEFLKTVEPGTVYKSSKGADKPGHKVRVMLTLTGAFVADVDATAGKTTEVTVDELTAPNHVPPPPDASDDQPVPIDTLPCLVGIGARAADTYTVTLLREQFWGKAPESLSLAPNSTLQKILTQTSGRTKTSSTSEEVSKQLDLSVSAGWGPFSAYASASLSTTSQRTDTLTIQDETTSTVVQTFTNPTSSSVVIYMWQLIDRIHVIKRANDKSTSWRGAVDVASTPLIPLSYMPPPDTTDEG